MIYEIYTENGTKKKRALTGNGYGLPLGTWISYEGTCPDGFIESEQTFNTTTYAALYALLGTNKVPERFDHSVLSDWEDITISTDANNPTVMDFDGFLMFDWSKGEGQGGGQYNIYINGVAYTYSFTSESVRGGNITTIPFKKGDLIYSPNFRFVSVCKVAYYKRHLAIKATPAYVEPDIVSDMVNTLRTQDSYSTSEVNTGKKWIDGKPIYRKCFTGLNVSFSATSYWFPLGIAKPTDLNELIFGMVYGADATSPYSNYDIPFNANLVAVGANNTMYSFSMINAGTIHKVVLEYTKTTD